MLTLSNYIAGAGACGTKHLSGEQVWWNYAVDILFDVASLDIAGKAILYEWSLGVSSHQTLTGALLRSSPDTHREYLDFPFSECDHLLPIRSLSL